MSQEVTQMPGECDRHWIRSSSGAGSQLHGSTADMEPHHAGTELLTRGGEDEGAWVFPWGGQEGWRTSVCWPLSWAGASRRPTLLFLRDSLR